MRLHVKDAKINGNDYLIGRIGGGRLEIPLRKIIALEMVAGDSKNTAQVIMNSNEQIHIQIEGSETLTGRSLFGNYTISLGDISAIKKDRDY